METILNPGDKVFVITRRIFEKDLRRHFVGEVLQCTKQVFKVRGYSFIFDESQNEFVRREDLRARIFSLIDAGVIINLLPDEAEIDAVTYTLDAQNNRILTDGKTFSMNISEFGPHR